MTDPRIEAATKAIREAMTKHGLAPDAEMLARVALAAADAAAWRPIEDCDSLMPVLVLQGCRQIVAQKIIDTELSDAPVWCAVEGETNEDSGAYLVYLEPIPTHWQPLPPPPTGGGNG